MKNYNDLIENGIALTDDFKFIEALDVFKEAKTIDSENSVAYIEAAKTCYLTKQYSSAVALHIVGLLQQVKKPNNPSTIAFYSEGTRHIANSLIMTEPSLQTQIKEVLLLSDNQMKLATDAYAYSLLRNSGKTHYKTYRDQLTKELFDEVQLTLSKIGTEYIKSILAKGSSQEELIAYFLKNINW